MVLITDQSDISSGKFADAVQVGEHSPPYLSGWGWWWGTVCDKLHVPNVLHVYLEMFHTWIWSDIYICEPTDFTCKYEMKLANVNVHL